MLALTGMGVYLPAAASDGILPTASPIGVELIKQLNVSNANARCYIFSDEEMHAYGIGSPKGLADAQVRAEMHLSWVPVFNNEQRVMDWMMAHSK